MVFYLNDHRARHWKDAFDDPFLALQLEHEKALFLFYGYRTAEGEIGRGYFALAHSLSAALRDLHADEDVDTDHDLAYLVQDAFIERDDDGSLVVHAELISVRAIIEGAAERKDDHI